MDIKIPATVTTPGGIMQTPFGDKPYGGSDDDVTVTLHVDDAAAATIRNLISGQAPEHLTADGLAGRYTAVELMAALSIALAPK